LEKQIVIDYRPTLPEAEAFFRLFETTGWNKGYQLTAKELRNALQNSWAACSAYADGELVGFGRVVSDGIMHAMIYEMIVLPEYQGKGIGAEILARLVNACREAGIKDVQLFCARGKRGFYEKYGFTARPGDAPGMSLAKSDGG
jgi:GNAT superfamily N-acetyltransferase